MKYSIYSAAISNGTLQDVFSRETRMVIRFESKDTVWIGVISDTHGHMPAATSKAFDNVDFIIHAGDIGDENILDKLTKIAPVVAVRGNMDFGPWADRLPEKEIIEVGHMTLTVIHIVNRLDAGPEKHGIRAVISGHTHRPAVYANNGVIYINPGSASYPKSGQTASAALIQIRGDRLDAQIIHLAD
jgi:putative phosphoesterase